MNYLPVFLTIIVCAFVGAILVLAALKMAGRKDPWE